MVYYDGSEMSHAETFAYIMKYTANTGIFPSALAIELPQSCTEPLIFLHGIYCDMKLLDTVVPCSV